MRVIYLFFLLFCINFCNAQNVVLSGKSVSYRGQNLEVFTRKDFISELPHKLGETIVDSMGNFKVSFTVDTITKIFIPSGRFIIEYFAYPELSDTILLPRFYEKPDDIFFVPRKVWAKNTSLNKSNLNNLIFNFERDFKGVTGRYTNRIATRDTSVLNDINTFLNDKYISQNEFFNIYKHYSLALTELMIYSSHHQKITDKYFSNRKVYSQNSAYTELFKKVFYKHIDFYRFSKRNNISGDFIYNELNSILKKQEIDPQHIRNYIILNLLKDACYNSAVSQSYIFDALKYFCNNSNDAEQVSIAENILAKTTKLAKGYKAPIIWGHTIDGDKISSAKYNGKFMYICFYESGNPRCIKDLQAISNIAKANAFLQVIFVCDTNKKIACIDELKNIKMQNNIIFCNNIDKVKEDFQLVVFPDYSLIDKDGNFIKPHTAKPNNHLFKQLNLIRIDEIREGHIKERSFLK